MRLIGAAAGGVATVLDRGSSGGGGFPPPDDTVITLPDGEDILNNVWDSATEIPPLDESVITSADDKDSDNKVWHADGEKDAGGGSSGGGGGGGGGDDGFLSHLRRRFRGYADERTSELAMQSIADVVIRFRWAIVLAAAAALVRRCRLTLSNPR